eukprot:2845196-Rhodomonas_salina.1
MPGSSTTHVSTATMTTVSQHGRTRQQRCFKARTNANTAMDADVRAHQIGLESGLLPPPARNDPSGSQIEDALQTGTCSIP